MKVVSAFCFLSALTLLILMVGWQEVRLIHKNPRSTPHPQRFFRRSGGGALEGEPADPASFMKSIRARYDILFSTAKIDVSASCSGTLVWYYSIS